MSPWGTAWTGARDHVWTDRHPGNATSLARRGLAESSVFGLGLVRDVQGLPGTPGAWLRFRRAGLLAGPEEASMSVHLRVGNCSMPKSSRTKRVVHLRQNSFFHLATVLPRDGNPCSKPDLYISTYMRVHMYTPWRYSLVVYHPTGPNLQQDIKKRPWARPNHRPGSDQKKTSTRIA